MANDGTGNEGLQKRIGHAKKLYATQSYDECSSLVQDCLSESSSDGRILAELHLLLAKCHRGRRDLKAAIASCDSSLAARPKWKDPYLYRSACFQAFHQLLVDTDGDTADNIDFDRRDATVIVGSSSDLSQAIRDAREGDKLFLEPGRYEAKNLFLCGKNVSIIGASVKDVVLEYVHDDNKRLETFLMCVTSTTSQVNPAPTLIKRVTFKSVGGSGGSKIKFVGVAGGTVQFEDCLFDATENTDADAIYTNAKIAGNLAANYPPPYVIVRFCVFDSCQSFGAFTANRSRGSVTSSYFAGCGRSSIVAMDCAKLSVSNCEFALTDRSEQTVSSSNSELSLAGSYFHGSNFGGRASHAVSLTCRSVAALTNNYIFRTGNGVSCLDSDLTLSNSLILGCGQDSPTALGLLTGICVKNPASKVQIYDNTVGGCDIGVYAGQSAVPTVRANNFENSNFAAIFVEASARPNIFSNEFDAGRKIVPDGDCRSSGGLGVLFLSASSGLVGKNRFSRYRVSPVMVFSTCRPIVRDNSFVDVRVDDEKQRRVEKLMLDRFKAELFEKDEYFYIVDGESAERDLQDVVSKKK